EIACTLDRWPARDLYRYAELMRDHIRERGLPHSRRTVKGDVLEGLAACFRGFDDDAKLPFDLVLVDVFIVGEALRPQRCLERALLARLCDRRCVARLALGLHRGQELTRLAMRSAALSRGTIS